MSGPFRTGIAPSTAELRAIDAIRAAYMACDATGYGADAPLVWETVSTAMGHLAEAGRAAWRQVGITDADLWSVMGDSGEGATYVYGLYLRGEI